MFTRVCKTEEDTIALAAQLARSIDSGALIYLVGDLGAGKTAFCRGFLHSLGYAGKVKSPTYTIVESYDVAGRHVYHFDFYRIKEANELEYIGIYEYFTSDAICLIEWPEKGFPLLPPPDLTCYILIVGHNREIRIEANSALGKSMLQKL